QGGKLARSAGSSAQLANKEDRYAVLKMPSGELRKVLIDCNATVGVVSNSDHSLQSMGKAGRNRWKGIRPRNRGVAMNPIDHPHGGGEGRTGEGRVPVSPWGTPTKGYRTRRNKRTTTMIVQRRQKR
ncbi:MAG: 50S ribosomal protein L2, partial [Burkholderiaceae bacterium]|nr:50S ribosomal protein L2 [Burkholderiaceae bacterium]